MKRHATTSGAESAAHPSSREASQPIAGKRKAEELSSPDGLVVPANRRPAPEPLVRSEALGTSDETTAESIRHLKASEGRPAYTTVVAGRMNPQEPIGQPKPIATGSDSSEPAVSPKAANVRMSVEDMSGPLSSMPADTTSALAVPAEERPNRTPIFVTGVTDTRGILTWLRALCPSSLRRQTNDRDGNCRRLKSHSQCPPIP